LGLRLSSVGHNYLATTRITATAIAKAADRAMVTASIALALMFAIIANRAPARALIAKAMAWRRRPGSRLVRSGWCRERGKRFYRRWPDRFRSRLSARFRPASHPL